MHFVFHEIKNVLHVWLSKETKQSIVFECKHWIRIHNSQNNNKNNTYLCVCVGGLHMCVGLHIYVYVCVGVGGSAYVCEGEPAFVCVFVGGSVYVCVVCGSV